jgi:hypothetical protein
MEDPPDEPEDEEEEEEGGPSGPPGVAVEDSWAVEEVDASLLSASFSEEKRKYWCLGVASATRSREKVRRPVREEPAAE